MGLSVIQKILKNHLVTGTLEPGSEISIRIDQTLTQDATGTMACLQFETMGQPRVKTELSVNYVDHNVLQIGFQNTDDHKYLETISKKYGLYYSKAGNGICHQVHLERFGQPGKTLLGSDSHTPTAGGLGMIGIGAGGLDIAIAMGGGAFYIQAPKIVRVELTGSLPAWCSAKDIILKLLQIMTTKGNVGCMVEYSGDAVKTLSVQERATITNMGAELGVTTSVFPSDLRTKEYLESQGRGDCYVPLTADPDAEYFKTITIDLSSLEPMIAKPHSPDNVVTVKEVQGVKVQQVAIGSCTNASYVDLMKVAQILKGKTVHPDVSLIVSPASRQTLEMISKNGALTDLITAGARITESNCGFCIGQGHVPSTGSVSVRTVNRNFKGRCGIQDAEVYLVSPEVAAVTALSGEITDPRAFGNPPKLCIPDKYIVDNTLLIAPSKPSGDVKIFRGPNIGDPPNNNPMPDDLCGNVLIKVGDKITTDHIMPAGQLLKFRSNIPKYSEHVFEPLDPTFAQRAVQLRDSNKYGFIVGAESYGQGSSREHAALCPMYLGIKAVITRSFERIHTANLINFGILPLTFANPDDYDKIEQGDAVELSGVRQTLLKNGQFVLKNTSKKTDMPLNYDLTERQRKIILAGGLLNFTNS
ncbi:MAG: aconitate hydratase [Candidatus Auribacterota bacterium]|jgi:aconitate hydratase|nr:aconitate hydratase [Candidatus Auribacterota bacterium]